MYIERQRRREMSTLPLSSPDRKNRFLFISIIYSLRLSLLLTFNSAAAVSSIFSSFRIVRALSRPFTSDDSAAMGYLNVPIKTDGLNQVAPEETLDTAPIGIAVTTSLAHSAFSCSAPFGTGTRDRDPRDKPREVERYFFLLVE